MPRLPKLCIHSPTNRYYVRIHRRPVYLGQVGGPEEEAAADAERLRVLAEHRSGARVAAKPQGATISVLVLAYDNYCLGRYRRPDGSPAPELEAARLALRPLLRLYGAVKVRDFTPERLEALMDAATDSSWMTAADRKKAGHRARGWCRQFVNGNLKRIKRCFKWGKKAGLVPGELYDRLDAVEGLRRGQNLARPDQPRRTAREGRSGKVPPAPPEAVAAVRERVSSVVRDMIDVQLLTGARPGEVCSMTAAEIDRSGDRLREVLKITVPLGQVWAYIPGSHKTEIHGKVRVVPIGPRAQAILKPYLEGRPPDAPLFSPADARRLRYAEMRSRRKSKIQPSQQSRKKAGAVRQPRPHWTASAYAHAIARACDAKDAGKFRQARPAVAHWHPHQLRHTAATNLEREFGYETARIVCGHSSVKTTHTYVAADLEKAFKAIEQAG